MDRTTRRRTVRVVEPHRRIRSSSGERPPTPRARRQARRLIAADFAHAARDAGPNRDSSDQRVHRNVLGAQDLLGEDCATWLWALAWRRSRAQRTASFLTRGWPLMLPAAVALVAGVSPLVLAWVLSALFPTFAVATLVLPGPAGPNRMGSPYTAVPHALARHPALPDALARSFMTVPVPSFAALGMSVTDQLERWRPTDPPELRRTFAALAADYEGTVGELLRVSEAVLA